MEFEPFRAEFTNEFRVERQMRVPTEDEVRADLVTFAWALFDDALKEAGPLTKSVLLEIQPMLRRRKKHVFVDSKIQYFDHLDSPVDSLHWHVDGTPSVENEMSKALGHVLLHDMYARMKHKEPPTYFAYQSWDGCATEFLTGQIDMEIPKCIPSFAVLDEKLAGRDLNIAKHPPGAIVSFDGLSLHRAVRATKSGWRLWIRVKETDHFNSQSKQVPHFFGTTFR
jgi:hypothetical protein